MESCDLAVVTGSQNNVRAGYRSGKPAIGVGAGNVPVIIDDSADLAQAAESIRASKTFDNATSCSSDNALVVLDSVYDSAVASLEVVGGYLTDRMEKEAIGAALWAGGKLNRDLIARDASVFADRVGLGPAARSARFFLVEDELPAEPFWLRTSCRPSPVICRREAVVGAHRLPGRGYRRRHRYGEGPS